jgi:hypothetical protein
MKLTLNGITRITDSPAIIADLKKAGYKEVVEAHEKKAEKQAPEEQPAENGETQKAGE